MISCDWLTYMFATVWVSVLHVTSTAELPASVLLMPLSQMTRPAISTTATCTYTCQLHTVHRCHHLSCHLCPAVTPAVNPRSSASLPLWVSSWNWQLAQSVRKCPRLGGATDVRKSRPTEKAPSDLIKGAASRCPLPPPRGLCGRRGRRMLLTLLCWNTETSTIARTGDWRQLRPGM